MALGNVTTDNINRYQGEIDEIERRFLFMGTAPSSLIGRLLSVNSQTNLYELFDNDDTTLLYQHLYAAQINGGQNWFAMLYGLASNENWTDAFPDAQEPVSCEAVVVTDPITSAAEVEATQTAIEAVRGSHSRDMFAILSTAIIDPDGDPGAEPPVPGQTWDVWAQEQLALVDGVAADRVTVVPNVHGNNAGVYAGRLCDRTVSIADSPMRVATGALVGLAPELEDADGNTPPTSMSQELDAGRLSVTQTYPDYPGTYWADGNVLDVPGGDFSVIEDLRVVLKAVREVRLLAIPRIADRQLNSTANSIAKHETYFAGPLRTMAANAIGDQPSDIQPPGADAVEISWPSFNSVNIFINVTPYNSAKNIRIGVALDRTLQEQE